MHPWNNAGPSVWLREYVKGPRVIMEKFALRVASKRQVTLPARLLELLRLSEGDVLELAVEGNRVTGRGMKLVPSDFFNEKMLEELEEQENSLDRDGGIDINNMDQLAARILKS